MAAKKSISAEAQRTRMLTTPIPKIVTAMAMPAMMHQIVSVVYNLVDTYFVAHIGTSAAAAIGIAFSLVSVVNALTYGVSMGARSLISRRLGAGDNEAAHIYASTTTLMCLAIGAFCTIFGLLFLEPILRFFGASPTMMPYAIPYCRLILVGVTFYCIDSAFSNILVAQGKASYSMSALMIASVANIIMDYLFVIVIPLGAAGAALATILSQFLSFSIMLAAFLRKQSIVKVLPKYISGKFRTYFEIVHTGLATVFRQGAASISSTLLNRLANPYGDAAVAAITIANKIYTLCRNLILGIGNGYTVVAGYNYGAGRKDRVKKSFGFSTLAGTAICLASAITVRFFPEEIVHLFRDDKEVVEIGSQMLRIMAIALPTMAFSTLVNQTYQTLGFSLWATVLACCRQGILFIPCLYVLHHFFGLTGITMTQAAADILTALVSVPFCLWFFRKLLNKKEALL